MLVIKVDGVDAEPLETRIAGGADVVGLAADAARVGIGAITDDGELGCKENLFALPTRISLSP